VKPREIIAVALLLVGCGLPSPELQRGNVEAAKRWAAGAGISSPLVTCPTHYMHGPCTVSWAENGGRRVIEIECAQNYCEMKTGR
jgi:hypothetical protein